MTTKRPKHEGVVTRQHCENFCSSGFCKNRGSTSPLIVSALLPSGCNEKRTWLQRDVRKGTPVHWRLSSDEEMLNRCKAAGCSNTPSDHVSVFKFPSDGILQCKREKQIHVYSRPELSGRHRALVSL